MLVTYDSRVVLTRKCLYYASRVVIYERKMIYSIDNKSNGLGETHIQEIVSSNPSARYWMERLKINFLYSCCLERLQISEKEAGLVHPQHTVLSLVGHDDWKYQKATYLRKTFSNQRRKIIYLHFPSR